MSTSSRDGSLDQGIQQLCGLALLPAAAWLFLVVLSWFGVAERFDMLQWPLEETGAGIGRGFFLFVVLPATAALFSLVTARAPEQRGGAVGLAVLGILLALANFLTWTT